MASHQPAPDYLNDSDINLSLDPPSPPAFDSQFVYGDAHSPSFSHTPSYNGSYNGSPYSQASDLSFGDDDHPFNIFGSGVHIATADYDPTDFDPGTSSLLMFPEDYANSLGQLDSNPSSGVSLAHHSPRMYHDYSSPGSSNGGGDSANEASGANTSQVSPSPRLEVQHSFENMSFSSPAWGTDSLPLDPSAHGSLQQQHRHPSVFPRRSVSPHVQKPQSPPRLLMPDGDGSPSFAPADPSSSGASTSNHNYIQPPVINAPDDGGDNASGPNLHIIPATPVSGGGLGGSADSRMPFQRPGPSSPNLSVIDNSQYRSDFGPGAQASPQMSGHAPNAGNISRPPSSSPQQQPPKFTFPGNRDSSPLPAGLAGSAMTSNGGFLFSAPQRSRSKSDTSIGGSPVALWNNSPFSRQHDTDGSALSMDDEAPAPPPPTVNMNDISPASHNGNNFLQPDGSYGMMAGLRRSKSDSGNQRMGHQRGSRSEDIRFSTNGGLLTVPGMGVNVSASLNYQQQPFLSPGQDPPPAIRNHGSTGFTPSHGHSLSYGSASPSLGYTGLPQHRAGHVRRASSGSRSERGTSAGWNGETGGFSLDGRQRPSPYPSPNASPHVRYDDLPVSDSLEGYNPMRPPSVQPPQVNMGGATGPGGMGHDPNAGQPQGSILVSKQNVTTSRTRNASHNRRKQEATFMCPVPGCGSTFTRSFNLRGHIRSHNEEKPYLCHWPGCGKGFARQHDCKRHEQLHTNYRPFTCEGCNKPFARMDALNRHLRSEGGADCQRVLEASGNLPGGATGSKGSTPPNSRRKSGSHSHSHSRSDTGGGGTDGSPPAALPIPLTASGGVRSIDVSMPAADDEIWGSVGRDNPWNQQISVTL